MTSTSQEGFSAISVEFTSDTDPQRAKEDIQGAIDGVSDLPKDVEKSKVEILDFQNQPVLSFVLSTDTDPATLNRLSDAMEDKIKDIPGVEKVSVQYRNTSDIEIVLKPEVIQEKNLSIFSVGELTRDALDNYPAGNVSTGKTNFALTQETFAHSVTELRSLPLRLGGEVLPLGEVATVRESPAPNSSVAYFASRDTLPTRAITFNVFKTDSSDTGETVKAILEAGESFRSQYGNTFIFEPVFNGAKEIQKSFDQLFHDFALTISLVFFVLFIFFGLRQSVIAALAIPLTFLGTFLVMQMTGISINFSEEFRASDPPIMEAPIISPIVNRLNGLSICESRSLKPL